MCNHRSGDLFAFETDDMLFLRVKIYMLFAGLGSVRLVKNYDQVRDHSFLPYGSALDWQMTCLSFPAVNWF